MVHFFHVSSEGSIAVRRITFCYYKAVNLSQSQYLSLIRFLSKRNIFLRCFLKGLKPQAIFIRLGSMYLVYIPLFYIDKDSIHSVFIYSKFEV
jgi:hypothetical protein